MISRMARGTPTGLSPANSRRSNSWSHGISRLALDERGHPKQPLLVLERPVEPRRQQEDELVEPVRLLDHQVPNGAGTERGSEGRPGPVGLRHRLDVASEVGEPVSGLGGRAVAVPTKAESNLRPRYQRGEVGELQTGVGEAVRQDRHRL